MIFGLVTEGITDQEILSNVLYGYFDDYNLEINPLQPLRDETDRNKAANFGTWTVLQEYCKSKVFREAFQMNDYVIIQIDTDVCEDYQVSKKENGIDLTPEQLIDKVIEKFAQWIGIDFYEKCKQRIIFAISVHSIECWLLPIFYTDNKRCKTVNCFTTVNQKVRLEKTAKSYREISDIFSKRKKLNEYYKHNPSFRVFIEMLDDKFNNNERLSN